MNSIAFRLAVILAATSLLGACAVAPKVPPKPRAFEVTGLDVGTLYSGDILGYNMITGIRDDGTLVSYTDNKIRLEKHTFLLTVDNIIGERKELLVEVARAYALHLAESDGLDPHNHTGSPIAPLEIFAEDKVSGEVMADVDADIVATFQTPAAYVLEDTPFACFFVKLTEKDTFILRNIEHVCVEVLGSVHS